MYAALQSMEYELPMLVGDGRDPSSIIAHSDNVLACAGLALCI
jgi:hypothetical protein